MSIAMPSSPRRTLQSTIMPSVLDALRTTELDNRVQLPRDHPNAEFGDLDGAFGKMSEP
jgi:hypothetical protein